MKKAFLAALLCLSSTCFAAEQVAINVNFQYQHQIIKTRATLNLQPSTWVAIQNDTSSENNNDNILLLGKIADADMEGVTLDFLVIDKHKNPAIVSQPKIIAHYQQPAQISLKGTEGQLILSVTPTFEYN